MNITLDLKNYNPDLLFKSVYPVIPDDMKMQIKNHSFDMDSIGCSGSSIFLFDNNLVLKVERKREESDGEYQMLKWLGSSEVGPGKLPVPIIKSFYSDGKMNYLLMTKLKGRMACDPFVMENREEMVRLLAQGLLKLWETDITNCPRKIDLDYKLERALYRINNNMVDINDTEPETFGPEGFESPYALYEYLRDNRPEEEYVLTHGDYCLPNVFFDQGEISGYLDLGYCGIADKWQDIALAVRSIRFNLEETGKEKEYKPLCRIFFDELGIEPDEEKIRYYILLDELF